MERGVQYSDNISAPKRPPTRKQLEQDRTGSKEIASAVDHPTGQLFRCAVGLVSGSMILSSARTE
jgi:hypothetical protein